MTRPHIAAIHFEGRQEAAKKRVQKLLRAGYIHERSRLPNEPAILFLTKKGFDVLCETGALADCPATDWRSFQKRVQVSDARIRHELDVMGIRSAFATAIRQAPNLSLAEFSTWPKLYEFRATRPMTRDGWTHDRDVLMKPDGFIRIHQQDENGVAEHCFFLEVDRGTETLQTVASKAVGYRNYYRQGGFARRMGCDPARPDACPFRVLLIVPSQQRLANLVETFLSLNPPIRNQIWLSTHCEAMTAPTSPAWVPPAQYAVAPAGRIRLFEL